MPLNILRAEFQILTNNELNEIRIFRIDNSGYMEVFIKLSDSDETLARCENGRKVDIFPRLSPVNSMIVLSSLESCAELLMTLPTAK